MARITGGRLDPADDASSAHYQQNFSSSDAEDDKLWPKQDGIRWLDVMVRGQKNLPALQGVFQQWLDRHANQVGSGIDRQLFLRQRLILDPLMKGYSNIRGQIEAPLYALAGMVALVLLISGANSANLILSRGAARQREIEVRLSIGASRARVIRQLLTESLLLVGHRGGSRYHGREPRSSLLVRAALGSSPSGSPITASLDWRVLGFTLAASILTGLLCGVVPALRATDVQLEAAKKLGTRSLSAESRCNTQRFLVASQIAFVFVLLVTASWFSGGLRYWRC